MSEYSGLLGTIGVLVILGLFMLLFTIKYKECSDSEKNALESHNFYEWCAHTACSGKELILCSQEKSLAVCKNDDNKVEVVFVNSEAGNQ